RRGPGGQVLARDPRVGLRQRAKREWHRPVVETFHAVEIRDERVDSRFVPDRRDVRENLAIAVLVAGARDERRDDLRRRRHAELRVRGERFPTRVVLRREDRIEMRDEAAVEIAEATVSARKERWQDPAKLCEEGRLR